MGPLIKPLVIFLAMLWPLQSFPQGTITFDGPPIIPSQSQYGISQYYESGMIFSSGAGDFDGQFARNSGGNFGYPDDGSTYIQVAYGESVQITSQFLSFGLSSVDLAGYSYLVPNYQVLFTGYELGGTTITTSFSGTGTNFQTFNFPANWSSGLTKVVIGNAVWSLDNLSVTIPDREQVFCSSWEEPC